MKRLLAATVTLLTTVSSLDSVSNATGVFTSSFDTPPRPPKIPLVHRDDDDGPKLRNSRRRREGEEFDSENRPHGPPTREERSARIAERRRKAREKIAHMQPDPGNLHQMSEDEFLSAKENAMKIDPDLEKQGNKWMRKLWSFGNTAAGGGNEEGQFADAGATYDYWQQGYRALGAFIDCDSPGGDQDGSGDQGNDDESQCSRWMMWAAYINPNYQGGGRGEYFDDSVNTDDAVVDDYGDGEGEEEDTGPISQLDCHSPDTEWELLGVYRQEFYQFIEQISKHLWAIDDYEYVVALAGLAYMSDEDCLQIGYDDYGGYIYSGVQPLAGGQFQMQLYSDDQCLELSESGMTFDQFGLTSDMYLGSEDDGCIDDDLLTTLYGYWSEAQEYTLALVNEIYDEYKYCTLCMDYPTYQDGYFIGDTGTDEDDMINQCWKFHSHDSYTCNADCIALGDAQGTIVQIDYGSRIFGAEWDGSTEAGSSTTFDHVNKGYQSGGDDTVQRFKANMWLTFNGILFIATFLAFSVARGARQETKGPIDRKKSLLSRDERERARDKSKASSRKSRKTRKSRSGAGDDRTARSREARRSKSNPKSREGSSNRKSKSRGKTPSDRKENKMTARRSELLKV